MKFIKRICLLLISIIRIFWKKYDGDTTPLSETEYKNALLTSNQEQRKAAYEKAWESRKFEIENYWKRATYFWTFLVPAFAGYFAVINSASYKEFDSLNHVELYLIICIGFLISIAWALVNKGSKSWQRHWEIHVDLLEDTITGPLYKIIHPTKTYSVSKINELVSWFFAFVWLLLAFKYKADQKLGFIFLTKGDLNIPVTLSTIAVCLFVLSMTKGYGRGYFSNRGFTMSKRNITYK
jgi:hypothetical protein